MVAHGEFDIQLEADKAVERAVARVIQRVENEIAHTTGSCGCKDCARYWTRLANESLDWIEAAEPSQQQPAPRYQVTHENGDWTIKRTVTRGSAGSGPFRLTPFQLR